MYETIYNLKEIGLNIIDFAYMNKYVDMSEFNDLSEEKEILQDKIKEIIKQLEVFLNE